MTPPSSIRLSSDSSNQGCTQPLKLQSPTDQIFVIRSAVQLTVVKLTIFAFMGPFELSATLIIGQVPVSRIVIRAIFILLVVFPSHNSLYRVQLWKKCVH